MIRISKIAAIFVMACILIPLAVVAGDTATSPSAKKVDNLSVSNAEPGHLAYTPSYGYMWVPDSNFPICESEWAPWASWWAFPNTWYYGINSWNWSSLIPPWSMSPLGWGYDSWYGGWYGFLPDGMPSGIPEYVGLTRFQIWSYARWRGYHHKGIKVNGHTGKIKPVQGSRKAKPSKLPAPIDIIRKEVKVNGNLLPTRRTPTDTDTNGQINGNDQKNRSHMGNKSRSIGNKRNKAIHRVGRSFRITPVSIGGISMGSRSQRSGVRYHGSRKH